VPGVDRPGRAGYGKELVGEMISNPLALIGEARTVTAWRVKAWSGDAGQGKEQWQA